MAQRSPAPFRVFCRVFYNQTKGSLYKNRQSFVKELLTATGAKTEGLSDAAAQKYFQGSPVKWPVPNPIDQAGTTKFLRKCLENGRKGDTPAASLATILSEYGCHNDVDLETALRAFVVYLNITLNSAEPPETFAHYYSFCIENPNLELRKVLSPHYKGDHVENFSERYDRKTFGLYETFTHEWVLINNGEVTWANRRLVCVNPDDIRIRPLVREISIPRSNPSRTNTVRIRVELAIQHFEGAAHSLWRMVDADDQDCFPNEPEQFDITISAQYKPQHAIEVNDG